MMISRLKFIAVAFVAIVSGGCGDTVPNTDLPNSSKSAEENIAHRHESSSETCFICDETKRDAGRLWCKEHARYEDRCWDCQPQLEEKGRPWCEEHSLYENECFLCHPEILSSVDSENGTMEEVGHRHNSPGETCFICDQSKREAGRLWCKEHTRYEDRCWDCQPQLEEKDRPYCEEHWLYEDECYLFHPEKEAEVGGQETSNFERPVNPGLGLFCREHHVPEIECGICQPQRTEDLEPGGELKVRFETSNSAAKADIRTVPALQAKTQASIPAFCEVSYDENSLARITPFAAGIVRKVFVDVGQDVEAGEILVELHSSVVASAKAAFVSAVVDLDLRKVALQRERRLAERKISSEREVQEAEAAYKKAELAFSTTEQALLNYGFSKEEVAGIKDDRNTSAVLLVRAPFSGTLVERNTVVGESVQPGASLFSLADLGLMWLSLSIPADQAGLIRAGLPVAATFDGADRDLTHGTITWVNTTIDETSRMLRARAVVENPDRSLKAGLFGHVRVFITDIQDSVSVPRDAVQRFENKPYVFVKLEDDLFALRRVATVDGGSKDTVAIVAGLRADEQVVAVGGFTVMSEFLKSRLGAGCVDD